MKKLDILIHKRESATKRTMELEETDDDFELGVAFIDLKEVQSINSANDFWKGREIFFLYLSGTSYTIVGDMVKLAEEIQQVKAYHILGIN